MTTTIQNGHEDIRARHLKRQIQHRRSMRRRRTIFFSVLTIIALIIVIFFTPLFNIKHIKIYGNVKVETAQLKQKIGSIEEENLFHLNTKKIIKEIKTIPYIKDLSIKKRIIPVGIDVNIEESIPFGYIPFGEEFVIVDENFKVLEICEDAQNLCEIIGIGITSSTPGAILAVDDTQKLHTATECMQILIENEIGQKLTLINFTDTSNIIFNYENRLSVICGSSLDFSKKIGMFIKAVNSTKLTDNSRGTIDISISGKAIYTP